MEITFKYKGKIITTPNLEKKLKRMKISIDDIEIIDTSTKKKEQSFELEDYMLNKEQIIVRSTEDNIRRVCYITKGTHPSIEELFKSLIWNPQTKTGVKEYTKEFLKTMYYE